LGKGKHYHRASGIGSKKERGEERKIEGDREGKISPALYRKREAKLFTSSVTGAVGKREGVYFLMVWERGNGGVYPSARGEKRGRERAQWRGNSYQEKKKN